MPYLLAFGPFHGRLFHPFQRPSGELPSTPLSPERFLWFVQLTLTYMHRCGLYGAHRPHWWGTALLLTPPRFMRLTLGHPWL